ncbi:MAG: PEGA domain-containing protein [Polyangiaceae bacterium]
MRLWTLTALLTLAIAPSVGAGCGVGAGRAAVSLRMNRTVETPRDASVFIDEEYVGPLGFVAVRGVRLPVGEHRITVQKEGYFPWDQLVVADREPIHLEVVLEPIPD